MGENKISKYKTYKNTVMPHGRHIYAKVSDMTKATMCEYPQSDHAFPQWNCVLRCCETCLCVNLTDQETDYQYYNTSPSIRFHVYHLILSCTTHRRLPINDRKIFA